MNKFDVNVAGYLRQKYGEEIVSDAVAYKVKRDKDGTTTLEVTLVVGAVEVQDATH